MEHSHPGRGPQLVRRGVVIGPEGEPLNIDDSANSEKEFFPRGAIAFFAAVIGSYGLIWLGIFLLLIHRQSGL